MLKASEKSISQGQLYFLIIQSQMGVGILSLPFAVHSTAKGDGWISTILAGIVLQIWLLIFLTISRWFPEKNIYQIMKHLFGRFVGSIFVVAYILYFTAVAALVAVLQTGLINKWILTLTPFWLIYVLIIIVAVYLATDNILTIARFFSLSTGVILFFILLVSTVYRDANLSYILPIGDGGIKNIFIATKDVLIALAGFEIILMVYPLLKDKKKTFKTLTLANVTTISIYTFLVFTSFIIFSPVELTLVPEPVLYMLKAISFEIIERLDLIFLSIWVIPMTNSFIIYLYQASKGLKELFHTDSHSPFVPIIVIPIFISGFFLQDKFVIQKIDSIFQYIIYSFVFFLPIAFLILGFIKKKNGKEKKHVPTT
ncbi:spore germination protein (amino acid permease) [Bacillus tianshenii]|uniref:Spore germination protein (Amino acid permease) n=1 Tax=Sutcliffiella tianshenii TaxID=1463404 RepID=A0ABS2P5M1_9BACI|nr:GerAB/ArcD/ProY family transporter [Bacillus tianshenii]MBM7622218.1 spore germination protein (amino acid permease) [Bacillus tianshenii]